MNDDCHTCKFHDSKILQDCELEFLLTYPVCIYYEKEIK